jgi:hypothetical protein
MSKRLADLRCIFHDLHRINSRVTQADNGVKYRPKKEAEAISVWQPLGGV